MLNDLLINVLQEIHHILFIVVLANAILLLTLEAKTVLVAAINFAVARKVKN